MSVGFLDVVRDVSGGNLKLPQSEFRETGSFPVVDQGRDFVAGYTDDEQYLFRSAALPVVIFGDHTKTVKFVDFPFVMGADGVKVLKPNETCDARFLYHYLSQAKIPDAGYSRHFKFVKELKIPLPRLAEQRRIAAILDKADALHAKRREAIAKLDQLLQSVFLHMFGHPLANERSWPLVRIGDVCSPKQWPTITGKQLESSGYPVYGANGVIGFYSSFNHAVPTILVTCRGATCGTINVCEARSYVTGNAMALNNLDTAKVELDYMATMLRMRGVNEVITGAAQPQITRAKLSPVLIPLPPLSLQTRFTRTSEAIADRKAALQEHASGLDHLFSSIQQGAFTATL